MSGRRRVFRGGTFLTGLTLLACAGPITTPQPSMTPRPFDASPSATPRPATPSPTAAPGSTATPGVTASPEPSPVTLGPWVQVGKIPSREDFAYQLIGFDSGYVALDSDGFWWSGSGSEWERNLLAGVEALPKCPGAALAPLWASSAVTNGTAVMLLGGGHKTNECGDPGSEEPNPLQGAAWLTTDGRTTTRVSTPVDDFDWLYVWPTNAGWEALVTMPFTAQQPSETERALWRSTDGITWAEAAPVALKRDLTDAKSAIAADGTRLIVGTTFALASADGIDWREIDVPFLDREPLDLGHVLAPVVRDTDRPGSTFWLVGLSQSDRSHGFFFRPEIWRSTDLQAWTQADLPNTGGAVDALVALHDDNYFVSSAPCEDQNDYCERLDVRQFFSTDSGETWSESAPSFGEDEDLFIATGPAGLIALRRGDLTVWSLVLIG